MKVPKSITQWEHLRTDRQENDEIQSLERHVRELQRALEFYAAPGHHGPFGEVDLDQGRVARIALAADCKAIWRAAA